MNDDEAFVRAIVAAPGDDAPRLVYADWLDERGDPRGTYLRAELKHPRDSRFLSSMGADIDPLWVARVSRPPVGICCDHLQFDERGPELTNDDILTVERNLGVRMPAQYRAFLLNHNGGSTRYQLEVRFPGNGPEGWWVERFLSVYPRDIRSRSRRHMADLEDVADTLREIEGSYLDGYLPIATMDHDDYLVIRCGTEPEGAAVVFFPQVGVLRRVSDSLAQFLNWLVEKAGEST